MLAKPVLSSYCHAAMSCLAVAESAARVAAHDGADPQRCCTSILEALRGPDGHPDGLRYAELLAGGAGGAEHALHDALVQHGVAEPAARAAARAAAEAIAISPPRLTGAEAVALILREAQVSHVFAYPGTSELAICDAVDRLDGVSLINGRGDKESAFMAAGGSLLRPNRAAAILHGARGLTNAAGAVADARRNEAGTMFVVGLPSTGSARFLPPHGERDLIGGMREFIEWAWEAPAIPRDEAGRLAAARRFVQQLRLGLAASATPPHRPAVFAVPQDVAEARWIELADLAAPAPDAAIEAATDAATEAAIEAAIEALTRARRPAFLVDDYALRYAGLRQALDRASRALGAPVLQLRYRRGPMLFERLHRDEVRHFIGWLNQFSADHAGLLGSCDLLITVEDRNLYERVVGRLPACTKLAINSDPEKVRKNDYLGDGDVVLAGNPAAVLARLAERLTGAAPRAPWFSDDVRAAAAVTPEPASAGVEYGRRGLVRALAATLASWKRPVLIDDSQMFGGLISEGYDDLPRGLRVFGGHGGFVGGGLAYATGLAIVEPDVRVMCTLGDQAFTNSFQALVAAIQGGAPVLIVVCNNGEAVSLRKQAAVSYGAATRPYLSNVTAFQYHTVARAIGLATTRCVLPIGASHHEMDAALTQFRAHLAYAAAVDGPSLIEIVVPSDPEVWRGIWLTQGFEQLAARQR